MVETIESFAKKFGPRNNNQNMVDFTISMYLRTFITHSHFTGFTLILFGLCGIE